MLDMPKSRLKLPPLKLSSDESFGQRLARFRKERGLTQVEMAAQLGLTQGLVTSYERNRIRLHAEMLARFSLALGVSSDALLGLSGSGASASKSQPHHPKAPLLSLKLVRRLQKIEKLSGTQQKVLLHTIDVFLRDSEQRHRS